MPFEDIRGQEQAVQILRNALLTGTIAHAYLFYGRQGVGKHTTAISLAKALLCRQIQADFCGSCSTCRRIDEGNHPDVYCIAPSAVGPGGGRVADPETGMILVDHVRELQQWLSVRSFEGGYKIAVIDGAERMNPQAANALLRTLEEPPSETVTILVSPSTAHLLPTIVSRCRKIYFPPLPRRTLEEIIGSRGGRTPEQASLLAALADGSLGAVLAVDEEWVVAKRRYWIERLLETRTRAGGGKEAACLSLAEEISRSPFMHQILEAYSLWYRDVLVARETGEVAGLLNQDMKDMIMSASRTTSTRECIENIELIRAVKKRIDARVNHRVVLEDLFLGLHHHPT